MRFVYDHASPIKIEKLRPEHVWHLRTQRAYRKSIKWLQVESLKMNAKGRVTLEFRRR